VPESPDDTVFESISERRPARSVCRQRGADACRIRRSMRGNDSAGMIMETISLCAVTRKTSGGDMFGLCRASRLGCQASEIEDPHAVDDLACLSASALGDRTANIIKTSGQSCRTVVRENSKSFEFVRAGPAPIDQVRNG